MCVERTGGPLGLVVAGANVNDCTLLAATLDAIVVERPVPTPQEPQHLCLDAGYDNPSGRAAVDAHGYVGHIRPANQEQRALEAAQAAEAAEAAEAAGQGRRYPARRWVVERTLAWLSRWRGLLVRWDKKVSNYRGCLELACALLWFRRWHRLTAAAGASAA